MSRKREEGKRPPSPRRERRTFSDDFKKETVQLVRERRLVGGTLAQVAREFDVSPDLLRGWIQKHTARDETGAPEGVVETPEQELRRLRRENAILKQEREFAKKVAVYFAKGSR